MVSGTQLVNTTVVSPADSSMWIATSARGLVRVGKNGKSFTYSVEKGDFSCNNIVALAFDTDGVLWIKDAEGEVFSYTSFTGFVKQPEVPQSVAAGLAGPVTKEETVAETPVQTPLVLVRRPWYGSWWVLALAILFFALFIWQLLKNRRNVSKSRAVYATAPATDKLVTSHSADTHPQLAVTDAPAEKPAATTYSATAPHQNTAPKPVTPKPAVAKPADGKFAAKVQEIVKANFTNPEFGVEDVAASLGISRVHLNRKLKAEKSPSPSDMIKTMRMELASSMLKAGDKSISEVAAASGFSSASYFSSAFKEYFGVAPATYLK